MNSFYCMAAFPTSKTQHIELPINAPDTTPVKDAGKIKESTRLGIVALLSGLGALVLITYQYYIPALMLSGTAIVFGIIGVKKRRKEYAAAGIKKSTMALF